MAQYVIHTIGFLYNDDWFDVAAERGPVKYITNSLEDARLMKKWQEIEDIKSRAGQSLYRLWRGYPNREDIFQKLTGFYQSAFGITIEEYADSKIPGQITDEQAAQLLAIMGISFYSIAEYGDDEVIHPDAFQFDPDESYWY